MIFKRQFNEIANKFSLQRTNKNKLEDEEALKDLLSQIVNENKCLSSIQLIIVLKECFVDLIEQYSKQNLFLIVSVTIGIVLVLILAIQLIVTNAKIGNRNFRNHFESTKYLT